MQNSRSSLVHCVCARVFCVAGLIDKLELCSQLQSLDLSDNAIETIRGVEGCCQLWKINLQGNRVNTCSHAGHTRHIRLCCLFKFCMQLDCCLLATKIFACRKKLDLICKHSRPEHKCVSIIPCLSISNFILWMCRDHMLETFCNGLVDSAYLEPQ